MSSSSKKVPLLRAIKKAAARFDPSLRVCAGDADDSVITRFIADEFWKMPVTIEENAKEIFEECQKRRIRWIIPSRDGELLFWARHKPDLHKQGIHVMVSDEAIVKTCLDKLAFYEFCCRQEIPSIPTWLYEIPEDVQTQLFVVKERFGSGSVSLGIALSREKALQFGTRLEAPLYQPFVEGEELSFDAYVTRNGDVKGIVPRKRTKIVEGESIITEVFRDPELESKMSDIFSRFGFYGHVMIQAFHKTNGEILLNEGNCRFGGASTAALHAGLDSMDWFLLESSGVDIRKYPCLITNKRFFQVRVPDDVVIDDPDF